MERVAYFFDGFNIYHSLDDVEEYHKYKWLDYFKLAEVYTKKSQQIVYVKYFTAYQYWKPNSYQKHQNYILALRTTPIEIIWGKYKKVTKHCKICDSVFSGYAEKQTDVNISIHLIKGALLDEYDTAILATADTDLVPVVKELKKIPFPKKIGILLPIRRPSTDLKNEADFKMKIKEKNLEGCQLREEIKVGNKIIHRPKEWK